MFCIDELEEDGGEIYSSAPAGERPQDKSSRIELYVLEWEKRHVPLDDCGNGVGQCRRGM